MVLQSAIERFAWLAVSLTDADLERPWSWGDYDEGLRFAFFRNYEGLRFRLHRFESHLRQHTIQIDKALVALGLASGEARRLVRMVYAGLAEVQGLLIGAEDTGAQACADLAAEINRRTDKIEGILP